MAEYINKTTAYEMLRKMEEEHNLSFSNEAYHKAAIMISTMPTEDVQPVVHARWIPTPTERVAFCSNCEGFVMYNPLFAADKYCRFCGAKMDKKEVK